MIKMVYQVNCRIGDSGEWVTFRVIYNYENVKEKTKKCKNDGLIPSHELCWKKRGKNFVDVPWTHDGQTEELSLKKVGTKL